MTTRNDVGNEDFEQARPVVDAAAAQKRRQNIIESVKGVVIAGLGLVALVWTDLISAETMGGILLFIGAVFVSLQVVLGRQDYRTALSVESLVTPAESPMDNDGVPLVPQVLVVEPDEEYTA